MENEKVKNTLEKQPPLRSVLCLKNRERIREYEKVEDCFILNFDPYKTFKLSTLSKCLMQANDSNMIVVAQHGKVACKDFPHSRHQCVEYPFLSTPHESYCKMCYCYVCDTVAPCTDWSEHCHATHKSRGSWWYLRRQRRGQDSESDSESEYGPHIEDMEETDVSISD